MRLFLKIIGVLFAILLLAIFGVFTWFWWKPVGVNNYINKASGAMLMDSPEMLTMIGMIDNTPLDFHSDELADYTKAQDDKTLAKARKARKNLDKYGPDGLEGQELLSWKTTAWFLDDNLQQAEIEYSGYRVTQLSGVTVNMPQFLTDTHTIKHEKSARRYVTRVNEFGRVLKEVHARVEDDRENGVVAPDFILEAVLEGLRSFVEGGADDNPLVTTLPAKLDKIEGMSDKTKAEIIADTKIAVREQVIPGYEAMITLHEDMLETTNHDAGIWRIPNGEKIYQLALRSNTTTNMTADEIHRIGLSEVARIEKEMNAILEGEGLTEGSVTDRVNQLMSADEHLFPNTDEGRQEVLDYLVKLNDDIMTKAGNYFSDLPPQKLEIVRIPEYSQDGAPGGYYNMAAMDGSRPGRFYINLKDTKDNPRWTLPTLLYHEAAPGHHFQISKAQNIKGVPMIRKMGLFNAYTEGWALYAERLVADDMNLYADDPLGDLGRLQAEMFRAVRLVVDTGMHAKKWSREKAIDYMLEKTGNSEADVIREIERYVVWPGQATAYKTGQLAILKIRADAESQLGDQFNLKAFHDIVLDNGALPLGLLEETVAEWVEDQKKAS